MRSIRSGQSGAIVLVPEQQNTFVILPCDVAPNNTFQYKISVDFVEKHERLILRIIKHSKN